MRPELCDLHGPSGFPAPENDKEDLRARVFGDGRGSHTDFWLCRLSFYLYIYPLEVIETRCWLQYAEQMPPASDMWTWRWCLAKTKDLYDVCIYFTAVWYFYLVPATSVRVMPRHWQSAHPSQIPPDHPSLLLPLCLHLSSTFVWFSVIRCESRRLLLLLMHRGLHIIAAHTAYTPTLLCGDHESGGNWRKKEVGN